VKTRVEIQIEKVLTECGLEETVTKQGIQALRENQLLYEIRKFGPLEKGMTNRLFHFQSRQKEYLIRIPGEGSEKLLDRKQEAMIYQTLRGKDITDRYLYINSDTGIKITEYLAEAHTCDVQNMEEVRRCIRHLYHFHQLRLAGDVSFDVFEMLIRYEQQCRQDIARTFPDYMDTRERVLRLKEVIEMEPADKFLCHVDPVPDNFLIQPDKISLIDWEYAAVSDPHMDIAMFCIYAGYDKKHIDQVLGFYFKEGCPDKVRRKIYCYVAACGLLWTVWCEIKKDSGIYFEEYETMQYQYAKDYYEYVTKF
jgi:thiamine kinase-like enzyme